MHRNLTLNNVSFALRPENTQSDTKRSDKLKLAP